MAFPRLLPFPPASAPQDPVIGEVMSSREEFLPSTDFRQPHFLDDTHRRYLDTYFRLLRYDIFGQLVDFLHQILLLYDATSGSFKVSEGDVRAYVYRPST